MYIATKVLNHKFSIKITKAEKQKKAYKYRMYYAQDIIYDILDKTAVPL